MTKHREYLLVMVREGAQDFTVSSPEDDFPAQLSYDRQIDDEESGFYGEWEQTDIDLPPGTYQLIGLAAELTEEQKKEIVGQPLWIGGFGWMFTNYVDEITYAKEIWKRTGMYKTSNESFDSLLRSHNLKPETTVVIKEMKK